MTSGMHLLILLAVLAVLALVVALIVRGWRRAGIDAMIGTTLTFAAVYAVLTFAGAVITVVAILTSRQLGMTIPVLQAWPVLPDGVRLTTTGPATIAGGSLGSADVQVDDAGAGVRMLWASGQSLGMLVPATIAALIALACFQLLRGSAFAPVVARAALITAAVVLVGGTAADGLSQLAGSMVSSEALTVTSATGLPDGTDPATLLPQPLMSLTIPVWPIGAGLGFAALAAVFRYGARLQREADLLV